MKKFMLMAMAVGALTFVSCSSDDDGGDSSSSDCVVCTMSTEGGDFDTEYCDNGDGTVTVTLSQGDSEISQDQDIPEGMTFDDYIDAQEQAGADCNN